MRRLLATVLTGVLLSACVGLTDVFPEGVLALRTIDGHEPISVRFGPCCRLRILSGSLQLHSDKTYTVRDSTQVIELDVLQPDTIVTIQSGGFEIFKGGRIVFFRDGDRDRRTWGTVQGDEITVTGGPSRRLATLPTKVFVYGR